MAQTNTFKFRGEEIKAEMRQAAGKGLRNAAEFILDKSNQNVPIDDSTLKNSGNTSVDTDALQASVSYDTPYAIKQHEDTTLTHKNGRGAKYLENAYKDNLNRIQEYVADAIKNGVK